MKTLLKETLTHSDQREDFNWGTTIIMILLVLSFIGASFYILVSSYLEVN
jgi:hypothetical protein